MPDAWTGLLLAAMRSKLQDIQTTCASMQVQLARAAVGLSMPWLGYSRLFLDLCAYSLTSTSRSAAPPSCSHLQMDGSSPIQMSSSSKMTSLPVLFGASHHIALCMQSADVCDLWTQEMSDITWYGNEPACISAAVLSKLPQAGHWHYLLHLCASTIRCQRPQHH